MEFKNKFTLVQKKVSENHEYFLICIFQELFKEPFYSRNDFY